MTFIVDAGSVLYNQYLWRFMTNMKIVGDPVGNISVIDNVEKIKINPFRRFISVEPVTCHTADSAAGAVFKYHLWCMRGIFFYIF